MLEAEGLARGYGRRGSGRVEVLRGLRLQVEAGELMVVAGRSGSGKTTLLHVLAALDPPEAGAVRYAGMRLTARAGESLLLRWRRSVGFLHQFPVLIPTLTAWENALLPFRYAGARDAAWMDSLFGRLEIADLKRRRPRELSGGQATRVALARALARRPPLLLADEPTGRLDADTAVMVWDLLRALLGAHGTTVVVVTHDPVIVGRAERVAWLVEGRLVEG